MSRATVRSLPLSRSLRLPYLLILVLFCQCYLFQPSIGAEDEDKGREEGDRYVRPDGTLDLFADDIPTYSAEPVLSKYSDMGSRPKAYPIGEEEHDQVKEEEEEQQPTPMTVTATPITTRDPTPAAIPLARSTAQAAAEGHRATPIHKEGDEDHVVSPSDHTTTIEDDEHGKEQRKGTVPTAVSTAKDSDEHEDAVWEEEERTRKERADKLMKEAQDRLKKEREERIKKEKEEAERKEKEEAERKEKEEAERKKEEAERKEKEEAESKEKEEAERKEKEEAERKEKEEAERKEKEEAERKEKEEAERKEKEEAERKEKEEAERKEKEETERKEKEEAERKEKEEAERKEKEEAERKEKEEAERKEKEETERKLKEEAERKEKEEATIKEKEEGERRKKEAERKEKELKEAKEKQRKEDEATAERKGEEEKHKMQEDEERRSAVDGGKRKSTMSEAKEAGKKEDSSSEDAIDADKDVDGEESSKGNKEDNTSSSSGTTHMTTTAVPFTDNNVARPGGLTPPPPSQSQASITSPAPPSTTIAAVPTTPAVPTESAFNKFKDEVEVKAKEVLLIAEGLWFTYAQPMKMDIIAATGCESPLVDLYFTSAVLMLTLVYAWLKKRSPALPKADDAALWRFRDSRIKMEQHFANSATVLPTAATTAPGVAVTGGISEEQFTQLIQQIQYLGQMANYTTQSLQSFMEDCQSKFNGIICDIAVLKQDLDEVDCELLSSSQQVIEHLTSRSLSNLTQEERSSLAEFEQNNKDGDESFEKEDVSSTSQEVGILRNEPQQQQLTQHPVLPTVNGPRPTPIVTAPSRPSPVASASSSSPPTLPGVSASHGPAPSMPPNGPISPVAETMKSSIASPGVHAAFTGGNTSPQTAAVTSPTGMSTAPIGQYHPSTMTSNGIRRGSHPSNAVASPANGVHAPPPPSARPATTVASPVTAPSPPSGAASPMPSPTSNLTGAVGAPSPTTAMEQPSSSAESPAADSSQGADGFPAAFAQPSKPRPAPKRMPPSHARRQRPHPVHGATDPFASLMQVTGTAPVNKRSTAAAASSASSSGAPPPPPT